MARKRDKKLNLSEIARRFHISRDRARALMADIEPAEVRGQTRLFAVSDVMEAMKSEHGPIPTERQQRTSALKEEKLSEQVKRLRMLNDRTEERLISTDLVREELTKMLTQFREILHRKLSEEWPKRIQNKTPEQVRKISKDVNDEICKELQQLAEQ